MADRRAITNTNLADADGSKDSDIVHGLPAEP